MITFVTLLLGLTTGVWPIEVVVGPGVAAVELRLDGRTVATLTQAPWKASVNLGPEPEPHELLAIGRDASGAEVVRARQMVNMPRPPAEASLILLPGSGGRARRARLSWQSALGMPPERIAVTFDGRPVPLEPSREIALPDRNLRPDQKIRFCWPVTRPADEVSEGYDIFMRSGDLIAKSGGLHALLTIPRAPAVSKEPRFADAISVAALSASGRNRARAVLFLYGGSPDASRHRGRGP